jgi:Ca2+-binding EF-hand superfamily protein
MVSINLSSVSSAWVDSLFAKLDTNNQGYIDKSNLESAFSKISGGAGNSESADDLFTKLDIDDDGKITKDEVESAVKRLVEQMASRNTPKMMRGRPEGPRDPGGAPPPEDDSGFSKAELAQQLDEIGSSDSKRADLLSKIVSNFEEADTDGNGKVSFEEARAYDQAHQTEENSSTSTDVASASGNPQVDEQILKEIMKLMQAYHMFGADQNSSQSTELSISNWA